MQSSATPRKVETGNRSIPVDAVDAVGGEAGPGSDGSSSGADSPHPGVGTRQSLRRRKIIDAIARFVVRIGGLSILLSILAIFLVILFEVVPLFLPARADSRQVIVPRDERPALALAVDPGSRWATTLHAGWTARFAPIAPFRAASIEVAVAHAPAGNALAAAAELSGGNDLVVASDSGDLYRLVFDFPPSYAAEREQPGAAGQSPSAAGARLEPILAAPALDGAAPPAPSEAAPLPGTVSRLAAARTDARTVIAALTGGAGDPAGSIELVWMTEKRALSGPPKKKLFRASVSLVNDPGSIRSIAFDQGARTLFAGTASGTVRIFDVEQPGTARELPGVKASSSPITAMTVLLGGERVLVGDAAGGISSWMSVGGALASSGVLTKIHDFSSLDSEVIDFATSRRNRTFLALSARGTFHLGYGTSGAIDLSEHSGLGAAERIRLSAKGDRIVVGGKDGAVVSWELQNPHAEISLGTLFGGVWYEGYPAPEYVWQSSSGNDEFEPKLSLVPLIFGSLKGTLYSLLFATPVALLAALYVSEFMSLRLKAYVKPVIELMAALPSVVIGFIAGLWLAPVLASRMPGLILLPFMLVVTVASGAYGWNRFASRGVRATFRGLEAFLMVPLVILGFYLAFSLGQSFEHHVCDGDFLHWIRDRFGIEFDQRNSIVVGIAMGFAVIPLIFTIAEDSLASVPKHLRAASLALGANRWQTALRVVLPAASPGIFSAIMLGFGRAIGETMIVLMATGNTPLMELTPFSGFRALSANIAVELPEAAQGGSLYRVLFLAALLLFLFAFLVNTVTEMVRVRLRRRYGQL